MGDDAEAVDLLDRALQHPVGHPSINNNVIDTAPQGNSTARALRTLRTQAPELHARVLAGEMSPNDAWRQGHGLTVASEQDPLHVWRGAFAAVVP